jgi:SAM-dependent methyltransferase
MLIIPFKRSIFSSCLFLLIPFIQEAVSQPATEPKTCIEVFKRGEIYSSRPLSILQSLTHPFSIVGSLREQSKSGKKIKILEFGSGQGRVMWELQKEFPNAEIHGINKCPWQDPRPKEAVLRETAEIFNLLPAPGSNTPTLHQFDASAGKLPQFSDNQFSFIISQAAVSFVPRQDLLLEEFWRILQPDGIAVVQLGRFLVLDNGYKALWTNEQIFSGAKSAGFSIKLQNDVLIMQKNKNDPLKLGLRPSNEYILFEPVR